MINNLTLGEVIRTYRHRAHLSQRQLAKIVGVHLSSISRWERDQSNEEMSIKHLVKIAKATKAPPEELIAFLRDGNEE